MRSGELLPPAVTTFSRRSPSLSEQQQQRSEQCRDKDKGDLDERIRAIITWERRMNCSRVIINSATFLPAGPPRYREQRQQAVSAGTVTHIRRQDSRLPRNCFGRAAAGIWSQAKIFFGIFLWNSREAKEKIKCEEGSTRSRYKTAPKQVINI